jgi:hypothetical protein
MMTFEDCVDALVALEASNRELLTPAAVDDIVDPYLVGLGTQATQRRELARAFRDKVKASTRRGLIYSRILHGERRS